MANEILRSQSYLVLATESEWGTNPVSISGSDASGQSGSDSPDYVRVPVLEYGVRFRPQNRQADPFIGLFQRKHSKNNKGFPQGTITAPLYGFKMDGISISLAQYLMDWAFGTTVETSTPPSKSAVWAEGPNISNKEHNGLRVNSATLSGSEDQDFIQLSMDVIGKEEQQENTAPAIPTNHHELKEFAYSDASFQLGGSAILLESFQVTLDRALLIKYRNSFTPSLLLQTQYVVTVQMVPIKNAITYDDWRRSTTAQEMTGKLTLKGLHDGTLASGNYAQVVVDFDRLAFIDADEGGGKNELATQPLNFVALKPDTGNDCIRFTWSTPS